MTAGKVEHSVAGWIGSKRARKFYVPMHLKQRWQNEGGRIIRRATADEQRLFDTHGVTRQPRALEQLEQLARLAAANEAKVAKPKVAKPKAKPKAAGPKAAGPRKGRLKPRRKPAPRRGTP